MRNARSNLQFPKTQRLARTGVLLEARLELTLTLRRPASMIGRPHYSKYYESFTGPRRRRVLSLFLRRRSGKTVCVL